MRQFLRSGRHRYALALFVLPASLVLMGNQCEPVKEPTKAPLPEAEPTGVTITPASHDFGDVPKGETKHVSFEVINHGPHSVLTLSFETEGGNSEDFYPDAQEPGWSCADGITLGPGEGCVFVGAFEPQTIGPLSSSFVVKAQGLAHPLATAQVRGNGVAPAE